MDYFGINSADELPKIKEVLAEQMIEPTIINHSETELENPIDPSPDEDEKTLMAVSEDGELIENNDEPDQD